MIVGFVEVIDFVVTHETAFLIPAFFHPGKTPLGAALGSPDRLAIQDHKNGVRVRGGEDAEGDPATVLNRHFKRNVTQLAISDDFLPCNRVAVDDHLHGDFTRTLDAGAFHVPIWLLRIVALGQAKDWLGIQFGGDLGLGQHGSRLGQAQFTAIDPHLDRVDTEIDQVATSIANVVTSRTDTFTPVIVR